MFHAAPRQTNSLIVAQPVHFAAASQQKVLGIHWGILPKSFRQQLFRTAVAAAGALRSRWGKTLERRTLRVLPGEKITVKFPDFLVAAGY